MKYITCIFFKNFSFQNRHKDRILWQFAKIRLEWISQSNGVIGRPLGFLIDRLNTSASLYRIAPCLNPWISSSRNLFFITYLLKCGLTDTVVHNIQSGSVSLQLTKDVRPTQTFGFHLKVQNALKWPKKRLNTTTRLYPIKHFAP